MTKPAFMECLEREGFKPFMEDGCVMISTSNKEDLKKMYDLAEKYGYDNSYGWRMIRKPGEKKAPVTE